MTGFLNYSSAAVPTTLAAPLSSVTPGSTGSVQVASVSGMPTRFPFTLILEWNTPNAEVVTVTQAATGAGPFTFANCVRGDDGTSAPSHNSGVSVTHGVSARDFYKGASDWINVTAADYGADPTGVTDSTAAIQAAINSVPAAGGVVYLPAGQYKISSALTIDTSEITLQGAGYGFATTIIGSPTTTAQPGMIVCGASTTNLRFNINIRGLAVKGGATGQAFTATNASPCVFTVTTAPANGTPIILWGNSAPAGFTQGTAYYVVNSSGSTFQLAAAPGGGALNSTSTGSGVAAVSYFKHGIVWRVEVGTIEDVICQFMAADGVHCSIGDINGGFPGTFPLQYNDSLVMKNCYMQYCFGAGIYTDQWLTSSEFIACHINGGSLASGGSPIGGTSTPFGLYGMNITGGALKFNMCHPFECVNAGLLFTSAGGQVAREMQVIGGEYETNLGAGIQILGGYDIKILGVQFYGNTSRDVFLQNSCKNIEISSSDFLSGINSGIEVTGCTKSIFHDNRFDAPSIGAAAATHAILMDGGFGNAYINIHDNVMNTAGSFGSAIVMTDAADCHVSGNLVASVSSIQEAAGANHNTYIGNDVVAFGAGAIQTVGASSRVIANPGFNPVGKITSPPAVAASTTAVTNSTGVDCMVIVTLAAAATATSISIGGNATGITSSVASAVLPPVNVPAGQTITLTYTNAPTWVWFGD